MAEHGLDDNPSLLKRTAESRRRVRGRCARRLSLLGVGKPAIRVRNNLRAAAHAACALGGQNCFVHVGKILRVRTGHPRALQARRLEWILAAVPNEAPADESESRKSV